MGKQTTKFTNSIGTMIGHCDGKVDELKTLIGARKLLNADAMTQIKLMDDVAEKHMPGGVQTEGSEEKVEKDPAYIKAAAALTQVNQKIFAADAKVKNGKVALDTALDTLEAENLKFEKFVIAKKKKWFGSKNSVPAAEACIKATKLYLTNTRPLAG